MNICEHLTATAQIVPDQIAMRFEGLEMTYAALNRKSYAASQVLADAGVKPGDRVALMLPNVPAFAVWYYAALQIGAIAVSLSTRSAASEVKFLTTDCAASCFVADQQTLTQMQEILSECVTTSVAVSDLGDLCSSQAVLEQPLTSPWVNSDPHDPAVILYTSGTTGFAKGATLSHGNVRSNVHAFNHLCNMQMTDRILLAVPLFHCFGQNALLNSALNVGATLVLQRRFDLHESIRLIREERVTQLYGVPMMFQLFLESCKPSDLASIKYCFSAAATLPMQVGERWQQKFGMPIHEGYGLTETSPFASYNHRLQFVSGSIGTPVDSVEMKIVNSDTGDDCEPGELGEIAVRGPNVMLGYWNRPEETAAAVRQGWFYSGDIGRMDERGYFYIVDRVKDMIAVGGLKVYPAEVERVILDHSAVAEVAVVGMPDDVFGEQVVAFVVLHDANAGSAVMAEIKSYARQHLANYKVPRLITTIDQLPRNPSGKVLKRELREFDVKHLIGDLQHTEEASAGSTPQQLKPPTLKTKLESTHASARGKVAVEFVQNMVQQIADVDEPPNPGDGFLDVGMDSLMIVELSHQIQAELGPQHEIPATLVFDYPRISDLADYLTAVLLPEQAATSNLQQSISNSPETKSTNLRSEIQAMSEEDALAELVKELSGDR